MSNELYFHSCFLGNLLVDVKWVIEFAVANHAYFFKEFDKLLFMFYVVVEFILF